MNDTNKSVTRRAGIVSAGTLASRILGLVRESVIAAFFPKEAIDAYQIAFMIPNSFRRLTAEGSFSISVTTVFSKIWAGNDFEESQKFVKATYGFALIFLLGLTAVGMFGAYWLTLAGGYGFADDPQKMELAVGLTRAMFPYIFFISLTAMAMGILNSTGRFFTPAFAPVFLNISIIGSAVGLSGMMPQWGLNPIYALAAGVIVGGVAQVLLQLPSLGSIKLLVLPSWDLKHPGLVRVLKLTAPMIFGAAAYQIQLFISNSLASTLGDGAVTYIQFSQRLVELPLAVLVMAISTAALPSLAALKGKGNQDEMKRVWAKALRLALFVATPAMVALIVLAKPMVTIMYQRGLFTHEDVVQTANALKWTGAGLVSVALLRQTLPVFYAIEKIWVPVALTFLSIAVFVGSALPLMKLYSHLGICMALSIAATVQALILLFVLRAKIGYLGLATTGKNWIRIVLATVPMGITVYGLAILGRWEQGGNSLLNIGVLLLCVVAGVLVYAITARVIRVPEFMELLGALRRRRRST